MHFCDTSAKKNPLMATSAGVTAPTLASSAASHSEMPAMSRARPQRAADAAAVRAALVDVLARCPHQIGELMLR